MREKAAAAAGVLEGGRPAAERRAGEPSARLTLEQKTADLRARRRDCRVCKAFKQDDSGMNFGWCTAFEQYVKLYHPAGQFWSQCQFKVLARAPAPAVSAEPATQSQPAGISRPLPAWAPLTASD